LTMGVGSSGRLSIPGTEYFTPRWSARDFTVPAQIFRASTGPWSW
jgi:hypothetical protein